MSRDGSVEESYIHWPRLVGAYRPAHRLPGLKTCPPRLCYRRFCSHGFVFYRKINPGGRIAGMFPSGWQEGTRLWSPALSATTPRQWRAVVMGFFV